MRVLWRMPKPISIETYLHRLSSDSLKIEFHFPKGSLNLITLRHYDTLGITARDAQIAGFYFCDCNRDGSVYLETKQRVTQTRIRHYRRTFK